MTEVLAHLSQLKPILLFKLLTENCLEVKVKVAKTKSRIITNFELVISYGPY